MYHIRNNLQVSVENSMNQQRTMILPRAGKIGLWKQVYPPFFHRKAQVKIFKRKEKKTDLDDALIKAVGTLPSDRHTHTAQQPIA